MKAKNDRLMTRRLKVRVECEVEDTPKEGSEEDLVLEPGFPFPRMRARNAGDFFSDFFREVFT